MADVQALKLADKYLQRPSQLTAARVSSRGRWAESSPSWSGWAQFAGWSAATLRRLVAAMANRHVRVARPSRGRRGRMRGEEAEC